MEKFLLSLMVMLGAIVYTLGIALIHGIFVFFLWNALVPELFGLTALTFWQAFGLTWLCNILFKGAGSTTINNN